MYLNDILGHQLIKGYGYICKTVWNEYMNIR